VNAGTAGEPLIRPAALGDDEFDFFAFERLNCGAQKLTLITIRDHPL
jgi:hypothetical protein